MSVLAPTIYYVLALVAFTKDGPAVVDHLYDNRFDCEVKEGAVLTEMRGDKDIVGWKVVSECAPVEEANKV